MSKIEILNVKKELRHNTAEENNKMTDLIKIMRHEQTGTATTAPNTPPEANDKVPEITKIKLPRTPTPNEIEKKTTVLNYFNKHYTEKTGGQLVVMDVINKMKIDGNIKVINYKFIEYLKELNINLIKKEKYYILDYAERINI